MRASEPRSPRAESGNARHHRSRLAKRAVSSGERADASTRRGPLTRYEAETFSSNFPNAPAFDVRFGLPIATVLSSARIRHAGTGSIAAEIESQLHRDNAQRKASDGPGRASVSTRVRNRNLTALVIFAIAFAIFRLSPLHPINDSRYSMMLSACLLEHRSFQLDRYNIPHLPPLQGEDYVHNGDIYQIEQVGPHLYYVMPPGTSLLSLPFVAIAKALGVSPVNSDGTFNLNGEEKIESWLAAFLMALLAAIFFFTAELLLPRVYSLIVAIGGAFGTQVWSTASRAMFTDTWAMLLLGMVIVMLLSHSANGNKLRPALIATMLAWAYLVYPTYAVHVAAISVYLLLVFSARQILIYFLIGAGWAASLVIYSWYNFQHLLPSYFRPGRLFFRSFWSALPGNLISPSRGLLVYVPATLFVAYLLIRFRKSFLHKRLVMTALAAIVAQFLVISGIGHWWGGHGYGPRYTTGMIPWFVMLAVLGLTAWRAHNRELSIFCRRAIASLGIILLALSVWINGRGAISSATWEWNSRPVDIDKDPSRIWDWRQPQFLAGLLPPPPPSEFPLVQPGTRIDFTNDESRRFLWYGWSGSEEGFRWSDSKDAAIIFSLPEEKPTTFQIKMAPFLAPGRLDQQSVLIRLNDETIANLILQNPEFQVYSISLPVNILKVRNVLNFEMPNAASPGSYNLGDDRRELGVRVQYAQFF
jgi:hypothetical protein